MIDTQDLQETISNLIRGKSDIALLGLKSSGKTTLAIKILDNVLGKNNYIKLNMLILNKPSQLMREIGYQILYLLKRLDSDILLKYDKIPTPSDIQIKYSKIEDWLNYINTFMSKYQQSFKKLTFTYIFMDNIQEYNFDIDFVKAFHKAIKTKLKYMRVSFFFCGLSYNPINFSCNDPFRNIICFIMNQPNLPKIINDTVSQTQFVKKTNIIKQKNRIDKKYYDKSVQLKEKQNYKIQLIKLSQFQRLIKHMKEMTNTSLQGIESNIQKIKLTTQCYVNHVDEFVNNRGERAQLWLQEHEEEQSKLLRKLVQNGPMVLTRLKGESEEGDSIEQSQQKSIPLTLQNYPNLILTSLFLAEKYKEKSDAKMYLFSKNKISENKIKKHRLQKRLNYDLEYKPHINRVISISQIIQQQADKKILLQKNQTSHSLDYYGCFQYLRQEGFIKTYRSQFGGIVSKNKVKQAQIDKFVDRTNVIHKRFLQ